MEQRKASLGKIKRPNVSAVLPRKRLFALLDHQGAAAWVTGPPGCGKTTLAASWLDHAGLRSLWYQLDEGDADIATFFYYLSVAAAARDEGAGEPRPLLTPGIPSRTVAGASAVVAVLDALQRQVDQIHGRVGGPLHQERVLLGQALGDAFEDVVGRVLAPWRPAEPEPHAQEVG